MKKKLTPSYSRVSIQALKEEGTAVNLNCEVHVITILTIMLVKAELWKGVFPSLFLKHQFIHVFYLSSPEKNKLL